jgi:arabinofuranosyltransferase
LTQHDQTTRLARTLLHPALLAPIALALITLCLTLNHAFYHDDAYITLRYARHLLAGQGPVWNTQGPRVEGFTSTLHLLLVTTVASLHIPLPIAARIVNVTSHLALVLVVFTHLRRRTSPAATTLGVLLVAASWPILVWDLGALDAVLYTTLTTAGVLTATTTFDPTNPNPDRTLRQATLLLAIATLARPEAALLLIALCLAALTLSPKTPTLRTLLTCAAIATLVLLPSILFRWLYFHALVPNTFYAKLGGISHLDLLRFGAHYLIHYLNTPPFLPWLALAAALYSRHKRAFTPPDTALWTAITLITLYILISGGDHMQDYRACLPLIPLLAVALVRHLDRTHLLADPTFTLAFIPTLLLALTLQAVPESLNPRHVDNAARVGTEVGQYIAANWPPGSIIALNTAGSTPYYADNNQYIDMLGLNDATIARRHNIPATGPWSRLIGHLKGDGAYVLSRHPDYLILGPSEGTTPQEKKWFFFLGDYEISQSPIFQTQYQPCIVPLPDGRPFTYYQRIDAHKSCPAGRAP